MPKPEPRAWWDDVQHLRDSIERKRKDEARHGLRLDARSAARAVAERAAGEANAAVLEADPPAHLDDDDEPAPRRGRRFERSSSEHRGRFARPEREGRQREARTEQRHEPAQDAGTPHADAPARPLSAPRRRRTVEI